MSARQVSKNLAAKIFDGYGPLSTLSAKIDIAYLFELIDEPVFNDLRALKEIRNIFAHSQEVKFFTGSEILKACQKLSGWEKGCDAKALFDRRLSFCVEQMERKTEVKLMASPHFSRYLSRR
jgi:DNA-binding MltR family transcriptional regulator